MSAPAVRKRAGAVRQRRAVAVRAANSLTLRPPVGLAVGTMAKILKNGVFQALLKWDSNSRFDQRKFAFKNSTEFRASVAKFGL
jgi:hypothetical protein